MGTLTDWNVEPNKKYFVKLSDTGSQVLAELFNTSAYAAAGTNRVAYGNCAYGADVELTLTNDSEYPSITYFNFTKSYHLKVTFTAGDSETTYQVGPFYDKDIHDTLCYTEDQQLARAQLEINRGTHSIDSKTLLRNDHDPDMRDGLVVNLDTAMFVDQDHMIKTAKIVGRSDGIILDELEIYRYENLEL